MSLSPYQHYKESWESSVIWYTACSCCLLVVSVFLYKRRSQNKHFNTILVPTDDSLLMLLKSANAQNRLPVEVQLQMIINWAQKLQTNYLDVLEKRFVRMFKRLEDLNRSKQQAELMLQFERVQLIKAKRHLYKLGLGPVSIGVQASSEYHNADGDHTKFVRFKEPIIESDILNTSDEQQISYIEKCIAFYNYLLNQCQNIWNIIKALFNYSINQMEYRHILKKILSWFGGLLIFSVKPEKDQNSTIVKISVLPEFSTPNA